MLLWKVIKYSYQFFYFFFRISFFVSSNIFYNFLELHSTLFEKDFCHNFSFFNGFTQTSHPLNSQNLLSVTKSFCQFSLKCLPNFFFKYLSTKSCKSIFYVSTVNCHCTYIFKGSNYRLDSLVFFSWHISRTAIWTQASVITCK